MRLARSWLPLALILTLLTASVVLWAASDDESKTADLASNAVAGAIIALAVLSLERALNRGQERQRQLAALATLPSLEGMQFRGADLSGAYASHKDLSGCLFADADMREARLPEIRCEGADFSGANLQRANFRFSHLSHSNFSGADLRYARLGACSLEGANLSDADLRGAMMFARLAGGPYCGADLRGSALFGADLRGVALLVRDRGRRGEVMSVDLKDAWANEETRWPAGFQPTKAGVNLVTGRERRAHDYHPHRAFRDPGFDDVTATEHPASALTIPPPDLLYPHGMRWSHLSTELNHIHARLVEIREAIQRGRPPGTA